MGMGADNDLRPESRGFSYGQADLTGRLGGAKTLYLDAWETECVYDWWGWATPVNVLNAGYTPLVAWSR